MSLAIFYCLRSHGRISLSVYILDNNRRVVIKRKKCFSTRLSNQKNWKHIKSGDINMSSLCRNLTMPVAHELSASRGKHKNSLNANSFIRTKIWISKGNCRKNNKD